VDKKQVKDKEAMKNAVNMFDYITMGMYQDREF
jgi:hypothetical protein